MRNYRIKILLSMAFSLNIAIVLNAQIEDKIKQQYQLSRETQGWFEGFNISLGGNDFIYHSLREDVTDCMLTRATDGKMFIEWETAPIPFDWKGERADLIWIAAMTRNKCNNKFFLYINDDLKFTFKNSPGDWEVDSQDGGRLEFRIFNGDQHGDAHGYMILHAPAAWIKPGNGLKIKVFGEAASSNCWCIIYKASDVLAHLQEAVEHEGWFDVFVDSRGKTHTFEVNAPEHLGGTEINYQVGKQKGSFELVTNKHHAEGIFKVKGTKSELGKQTFSLSSAKGKLFEITGLFTDQKETNVRGKTLVLKNAHAIDEEKWSLEIRLTYKPKLVENFTKLSKSRLNNGTIYLMNSSHQDIAWMDSPEKCILERDTMLLTPLITQAALEPDYHFDIEDVLMVREFIQRHPEKKEELKQLLQEGKVTCGSTYTMPYEEMYSGESLVRQFYLGAKWLSREFGNYKADTYWNVDVPGRTIQMPQIMNKAGTKYMVISRHGKGVFNWYSPDGSYVTAYSPGHYADAYTHLNKDFFDAATYIAESSLFWNDYNTIPVAKPAMALLSDWDMSPAKDYSNLINRWHNLKYIEDENGHKIPLTLPKIKIGTANQFIEKIVTSTPELPAIKGERPAVWLYIHGPSHQKALKASRQGDILLTVAEKFSAIEALLAGSFCNYPQERLTRAWEAKIYPDHGWGGKHGDITDALFLRTLEFARDEGKQLTETALRSIASRIKTNPTKGIPVVVFNSLSWDRTDPVTFKMTFAEGWGKDLKVTDLSGKEIAHQLSEIEKYRNGTIKTTCVHFIAENVPSVGYKTFYVAPSQTVMKDQIKTGANEIESNYYKISLSQGGIRQIYDKELGKDLLDVSNLKGAEVFTMRSEGNGAGEFADIQQPTMERFDKTSNHPAKWEWIESGAVYNTFQKRQKIRNAVVEQKIIVYNNLKRIDIETSLLNWEGILYREYRMAFPLNMKDAYIAYEVPFGVVEVGKDEIEGAAGERYVTPCKDMHPRGIQNWIGAYDSGFGVTISSSVAVADYVDPTGSDADYPILQPILLASRKSCHGEGNEYLQTGDHFFTFSFTSHKPGWRNGYKFGKQANEKFFVVVAPELYNNAMLPEEKSFFSPGAENLIISTIKKCEDNDDLILRIYEMEGNDTRTKLNMFFDLKNAEQTNMIEEEGKPVSFSKNEMVMDIGHHAIETYKLKMF